MFYKNTLSKFFLLASLVVPFSVKGQDSIKPKEVPTTNVEIVLNKIHNGGRSEIKSRDIFILIQEKDFSLENIKSIFDEYKKLYPEPYILRISVYSSQEMLQRLIDFEDHGLVVEFSRDEKGREAAAKFYEKYYPLPKGYFRATYYRYGKFEFFDYSPKKDDSEMVRISLKDENDKSSVQK